MHNLKTLYRGGLGGHVCLQCRRYVSTKTKTHYEVLGVVKTASDKEIRSAYIDLSKKYHPDTAGSKSKKRFTEISEAYSVLSKPLTRREYDNKITLGRQTSYNQHGPYSHPGGSQYANYRQREEYYRNEGSPFSEYERKRQMSRDHKITVMTQALTYMILVTFLVISLTDKRTQKSEQERLKRNLKKDPTSWC